MVAGAAEAEGAAALTSGFDSPPSTEAAMAGALSFCSVGGASALYQPPTTPPTAQYVHAVTAAASQYGAARVSGHAILEIIAPVEQPSAWPQGEARKMTAVTQEESGTPTAMKR